MCNYEQTALNRAHLFAPIEYLFATKTFPQLRILQESPAIADEPRNAKACQKLLQCLRQCLLLFCTVSAIIV